MPIPGYRTIREESALYALHPLGNTWSRRLFDGTFYRCRPRRDLPAVSLVFVQSRGGNTVAENPSTLGGGETDKHLIYEGLSRVDADAVMAGATTARSGRIVFSVWHPEMIGLRAELGHPRHPAQIVLTNRGVDLPLDRGILFREPSVRVIVITTTTTAVRLRARVEGRPWVEILDAGEPVSLTRALRGLFERGIRVISAVGGRRTAGALLREHLVDEVYLTTSAIDRGEPDTPFYTGARPRMVQLLEKAGQGAEAGVRFEHLIVA